MIEKSLEKIGLTKNEAKIYLTLLRLGSAPVGKITEKSGIHRRNVYDSLERLMKRGLIGHIIKKNIKYFEAVSPTCLLDILKEEREDLEKKMKNINSILPELLSINVSREKEYAITYKDVKGIKTLLDDILKTKKPNLALGVHEPSKELKNYLTNFYKRRVKLRIKDKMIFDENDRERAKVLSKMPFTEVRFLTNNSKNKTTINIYGDKIAIRMACGPTGVVIENEDVANTFREYFNFLWNISRKD